MQQKAVFWFTDDLRLQDNRPLNDLCQKYSNINFVYVLNPADFTPHNYQHKALGQHRFHFIYESLQDLDKQLNAFGHSLTLLHGDPCHKILQFVQFNDIRCIARSEPIGIYEQRIWQQIKSLLKRPKENNTPPVEFISSWNHTLFDAKQVDSNAKIMRSFSSFRRYVESNNLDINIPYESLKSLSQQKSSSTSSISMTVSLKELDERYFKQPPKQVLVTGGELSAHEHLTNYFSSSAPSIYKQTRNRLDGWDSSTKFSPFLASGNLSPRQIWHKLKDYENHNGANDSTYWIGFELLWREYFQWTALEQQSRLFAFKGLAIQAPKTSFYPERFKKWCEGNTPYPLVNACMKELAATGFMSNRGRQIVASCLVHELATDWRFGAAYFQQQLIDYDVASNWGNWQYIAGVGKDPRGGRQFNIEEQTSLHDPEGEFIHKWQGHNQTQLPLDSVDAADWPILPQDSQ